MSVSKSLKKCVFERVCDLAEYLLKLEATAHTMGREDDERFIQSVIQETDLATLMVYTVAEQDLSEFKVGNLTFHKTDDFKNQKCRVTIKYEDLEVCNAVVDVESSLIM